MQQVEVDEILQIIYSRFRERGGNWPDYDSIGRWLSRFRQLDVTRIVVSIPETFLKPLDIINGRPDPQGKMILSIAGVSRCRGSDDDVQNFISAVQLMVRRDNEYDPPPGGAGRGIRITAGELSSELRLPLVSDTNSINRLIAILKAEDLVSDHEYI